MKNNRKRLLIPLLFFVVIIICKGNIFRTFINYQTIGNRNVTSEQSVRFVDYLSALPEIKNANIKAICEKSLEITSAHLNYTFRKCKTDPVSVYENKFTNCIGYSMFYASICNHYLNKYKLNEDWKVTPKVGKLYFSGLDIHRLFDQPNFKDHDFVSVTNQKTGEKIFLDPTLHDYSGISRIKSVYE